MLKNLANLLVLLNPCSKMISAGLKRQEMFKGLLKGHLGQISGWLAKVGERSCI
jgi:hypothetical protein